MNYPIAPEYESPVNEEHIQAAKQALRRAAVQDGRCSLVLYAGRTQPTECDGHHRISISCALVTWEYKKEGTQ